MAYVKVDNVSKLVTEENLKELFECCGDILRMKLQIKDGKTVCCIHFADQSHGDTALMLHGTEIGDSKLHVSLCDEPEAKSLLENENAITKDPVAKEYENACALMQQMMQGPDGGKGLVDDEVKRTVYVGNLSQTCTPQNLHNEFKTVGEVAYIKFSQGKQTKFSNNDFRYAFIEFATEEQARLAFTLHGRVVAGSTIKVGKAHNPIFKDDISDQDNPLFLARKHADRIKEKVTVEPPRGSPRDRNRRNRRSRDRNRSRRRRRRRSRSRSYERSERSKMREREKNATGIKPQSQTGKEPQMFWDGFQWHFNDTKLGDIEEHVTSVIRSDVDIRRMDPVDTETKMQNAAAAALKTLQRTKGFTSYQ